MSRRSCTLADMVLAGEEWSSKKLMTHCSYQGMHWLELLDLCSQHVKCVVLNACYSEVQAQPIGSAVEYVIGMSRAIGDRAAIKFSTGFYDALASGRSYTDAFRFGCNAISLRGIPESLTPTAHR